LAESHAVNRIDERNAAARKRSVQGSESLESRAMLTAAGFDGEKNPQKSANTRTPPGPTFVELIRVDDLDSNFGLRRS
jgi:hypothetical protein